MAGGGSRRGGAVEEPRIGTGNVFAALETLKKKKKKKPAAAGGKGAKPAAEEPKPEVFWAPAPLTAKSWADVEDDDDYDYFATTAPPPRPVWGNDSRGDAAKDQRDAHALEEEVESEDDGLDDEVEDDADEEHEHEHDAEDSVPAEPTMKNSAQDESNGKKDADQVANGEKREMHLLQRVRVQRRRNLRKTSLQRSQRKHRNRTMGRKK